MNAGKERLLNESYEKLIKYTFGSFPVDLFKELLAEDFMGYGTAIDENIFSEKDYLDLINRQRQQSNGQEINFKETPVFRRVSSNEDTAIFVSEFSIDIMVDGNNHELFVRLTVVMEYINKRWLAVHFHTSKPGSTLGEEDTWHIDEWKRKNEELRKLVEEKTSDLLHKNRDLEIEAALERVRARTMAMQKSQELDETAEVLQQQLKDLGILVHSSFIGVVDNLESLTNAGSIGKVTNIESIAGDPSISAAKKMEKMDLISKPPSSKDITFEFYGAGKDQIPSWITKQENMKQLLSGLKNKNKSITLHSVEGEFDYVAYFSNGFIGITTTNESSADILNLLERFAGVFDLTYTRFLDLQKAEEQTREAKIEAALEKVRGRAMAMHNSSDLTDAAGMVFTELNNLGIKPIRSGFVLLTKDSRRAKLYPATSFDNKNTISFTGEFEFTGHPVYEKQYESWQKKENYFPVLEGDILKSYYKILAEGLSIPYENFPTDRKQFGSFLPFTEGFLFTWSDEPNAEKEINILDRFRGILDLTIRRYLDLKKAEAQAREAQIEAALERVRSKAMSMQKSEDLALPVATIFDEMDKLNLGMLRCGIGIIDGVKRSADVWTTTISDPEKIVQVSGDESMDIHPLLQGALDAWQRQEDFLYLLQGEDLKKYYEALTRVNFKLPDSQSIVSEIEGLKQYYYVTTFQAGALFAFRETPFPDEAKSVMKRFADVFSLTYTRFNDLKQAELQTHKAQIEVALERVRARALAMHEPEELIEVAQVLRHEMGLLGIEELETGTIFTINESSDRVECWFAIKDTREGEKNLISDHITLELSSTWVGREMKKFYTSDEKQISIPMKGVHRKEWIEYCSPVSPKLKSFYGENIPDRTYHLYKSSDGIIGALSPGDISEESWDLLKRAASVFSLAYSRFKDLTQARTDLQNLKEEKKRSESLLLNILPEEIANELKQFGKSYARKHEQVSILFADITMFSTIAENLSAEELVTQLDECFRAFDNIVQKHGMEKIKTVGDAYICACGLPKPVNDNAAKTVAAAMDMIEFIKGFGMTKKIQNLPPFEFRIGIHTGPVITGVVGLKKFTYDIWGDAVNMAARMEQHGEAGRINISGNTYELVKDKFKCIHRGKIQAKNKGEVDMYFVETVNS